MELNYLGEEFDDDMIYVYMEVEGLDDISSLKILIRFYLMFMINKNM